MQRVQLVLWELPDLKVLQVLRASKDPPESRDPQVRLVLRGLLGPRVRKVNKELRDLVDSQVYRGLKVRLVLLDLPASQVPSDLKDRPE